MYVAKHYQWPDRDAAVALMQSHPLGAWVCHTPQGLVANHVPFMLARTPGPHGTLRGHVARANPVWRQLTPEAPSLVMFQGPQAYITPGWYPGKAEHGKVVPTWDYVVVHAHGVMRAVDDRDWLLAMLNQLTDPLEAPQRRPWQVNDAPGDYIDKMLRAIVGIELHIERLECKLKASQDEDLPDRLGTVAGLQQQGTDGASQMAALVHQAISAQPQPAAD